jgi:molybdopterin converting factor small subunit
VAEPVAVHLVGQAAGHASAAITATVRYFAAARAAAGVNQEMITVTVPAAAVDGSGTVGEVLEAVAVRHGPVLARVLQRCSYLLDEVAVHGLDTPLRDGQVLDVLPPFAGG